MHIGIKGMSIAAFAVILAACSSPTTPGPTVTTPATTSQTSPATTSPTHSSVSPSTTSPPKVTPTTPVPPATCVSPRPTLKYGSTGVCVRDLQVRLNAHGAKLPVTGTFGSETRAAVVVYQTQSRLTADGIVGSATWNMLLGVTSPSTPPPPPVSSTYNKYTCGNAGSKVLLVFDDYPLSSAAFKSLIDTAKQNGIGIGVAPNGEYVQSGRAPVGYARAAGMLVVDHTYDHKDLTTLSVSGITWEITRPYVDSNYVRPPYGAENATVRSVLAQNHKYDCLWNLDPRDWDGRSPKAAADYIIANARPGSTAVVHMDHLGTQPSLLPYIKAGLAKRGIAMCAPWSKPTTPIMPGTYCS